MQIKIPGIFIYYHLMLTQNAENYLYNFSKYFIEVYKQGEIS